MKKTTAKATTPLTVAQRCADAYSADSYGTAEWANVAGWLASLGFSDRDIEAILRSKYTRWAEGYGPGEHNLASFKAFWAACPKLVTRKAIDELVAQTFDNKGSR